MNAEAESLNSKLSWYNPIPEWIRIAGLAPFEAFCQPPFPSGL
jgi:hypothetical protein